MILTNWLRNSYLSKKLLGSQLKLLYLTAFFLGGSSALTAYINSSFLKNFLPEKQIGYIYSLAYLISIVALYYFIIFIRKFGKKYSLVILLILEILTLINLSLGINVAFVVINFLLYLLFGHLILTNLNIVVESLTQNKDTGQIKGWQYILDNAGWVIFPLIAGFLLSYWGFQLVYFCSAIMLLIMLIIVLTGLKNTPDHLQPQLSFRDLFIQLRTKKSIIWVYLAQILLNLFFSFLVIYIPLYLINQGFSWTQIGLMTTIALLPYFLQYPVGLLADKICGEKEFLLTGFLILIITAISIFWLNSASFWVWLLVLFIARIGASLINIMSDTYFYKKVNVKDISLIDFYHSAGPVGYLIGPLAASILLIFIDLKLLFLMAGIIMVLGLVGALKLQDTK